MLWIALCSTTNLSRMTLENCWSSVMCTLFSSIRQFEFQLTAQMTPLNDSFDFKAHAIKYRFICTCVDVIVCKQSKDAAIQFYVNKMKFRKTLLHIHSSMRVE